MASNISLLVHRPIIPMMRLKLEKDLRKVTITNTIIPFTNHVEYRRLDVFVAQDGDVETYVRLIDTFLHNDGASE